MIFLWITLVIIGILLISYLALELGNNSFTFILSMPILLIIMLIAIFNNWRIGRYYAKKFPDGIDITYTDGNTDHIDFK